MTDHGPASRLLICNHPVEDARLYPLREQLSCCLDRLEQLTRWFLSIVLSPPNENDGQQQCAERRCSLIMKRLVDEQRLLLHLRELTLQQLRRQSELKQVQSASSVEATKLAKYVRLLKEADLVLGNGIEQVQEKLDKIERSRPSSCELVLNHAFLMSRSHSVHCPLSWKSPADLRRPYPLDVQMRQGCLAQRLKILSLEDELIRRGWRAQPKLAMLDSMENTASPSLAPGTPVCGDVSVVTSQTDKGEGDSFAASHVDSANATSLFSMDIFAEESEAEASSSSNLESDSSSSDFL